MDAKKDILLERFQEEVGAVFKISFIPDYNSQHPGFDFRNATVNGMVFDIVLIH
jgi:hypothetical protein